MWQNFRDWLISLLSDHCDHQFKVISRNVVSVTGWGYREKYEVQCKKCAKHHTRHVHRESEYSNESIEHAANHGQLLGEEL